MFQKITSYLSAFALGLVLTACAVPGTQQGELEVRSGVIEQINPVQIESAHQSGVGAVVGGIAGLGLGSLIGGGSGRDVAMVLGTVGGAYAGNEMQKKYDKPVQGQQIIVRARNGVLISVTQPVNPNLRKGQKVYVEGNGDGARVVAR